MVPGLERRIVTLIRIQTACPERSWLTSHTARLAAGQRVNLAAALRRVWTLAVMLTRCTT